MSSEVEICNRALTEVGSKTVIALDSTSKRSRLCLLHYAPQRDALLRSYNWKFAIERATLALIDETVLGFNYSYQLPTNYLRIIYPDVNQQFYRIEKGRILTNLPLGYIRYIFREENPTKFDASFQEALALRIAIRISKSLSDNTNLKEQLKDDFDSAIREARNTSAIEDGPNWIDSEEWLSSRYMGIAGPTGWLRDNRRY